MEQFLQNTLDRWKFILKGLSDYITSEVKADNQIIKMEISDVFFHEGGGSRVPHNYFEK